MIRLSGRETGEPSSSAFWLLAFAYLLPSFFAWMIKHRHYGAIFVLNLLLGWTGVGWAVAFVWSFVPAGERRVAVPAPLLPAKRRGESDAEYGARLSRLQADLQA